MSSTTASRFPPQVHAAGFGFVDHVAIFKDIRHWNAAVELIKPQGAIVSIEDTDLPMPMAGMKTKAASVHWEFMFATSTHQTSDMIERYKLLSWVAGEIDAGCLCTTIADVR